MTKKLADEEKKRRKKERHDARAKAQGPPSQAPPQPVNLCDDCAYEFGECEGVPKFGEGEAADNVLECPGFVNVATMPTADKATPPGPAVTEDTFPEIVIVCSGGCGKTTEGMTFETKSGEFKEADDPESGVPEWTCPDCVAELVAAQLRAGATEEDIAENQVIMTADIEARRRKLQRFGQDEDFGPCQSCGQALKRTAYNRERDAVRCVNGRCRQYRFIIKVIPLGV